MCSSDFLLRAYDLARLFRARRRAVRLRRWALIVGPFFVLLACGLFFHRHIRISSRLDTHCAECIPIVDLFCERNRLAARQHGVLSLTLPVTLGRRFIAAPCRTFPGLQVVAITVQDAIPVKQRGFSVAKVFQELGQFSPGFQISGTSMDRSA
jgi:hypothetical protein